MGRILNQSGLKGKEGTGRNQAKAQLLIRAGSSNISEIRNLQSEIQNVHR